MEQVQFTTSVHDLCMWHWSFWRYNFKVKGTVKVETIYPNLIQTFLCIWRLLPAFSVAFGKTVLGKFITTLRMIFTITQGFLTKILKTAANLQHYKQGKNFVWSQNGLFWGKNPSIFLQLKDFPKRFSQKLKQQIIAAHLVPKWPFLGKKTNIFLQLKQGLL